MNIDELSSDIVFSKENQFLFDKINKLIREDFIYTNFPLTSRYLSFTERWFRILNYDINDFDNFIGKHDSLYWFLFFNAIIHHDQSSEIYRFFQMKFSNDANEKFIKFSNHIINTNLPSIYKLYEITNEEPPFRKFYNINVSNFCKILKNYFDKNFELMHNSFGGFLFLIQNIETPLIENIFHLYEDHKMFSKYFNSYDKIKKEDHQNFRKFWYYLVKYQKVPMFYINKFLMNFEHDKILKMALNTAKYHEHYWSKIEENRIIFKKLKMNSIFYPVFDKD